MSVKKEFKITKKKEYNIDDFTEVTDEFNDKYKLLLEEIIKYCTNASWREEIKNFQFYISQMELALEFDKVKIINSFSKFVYPHWEIIKEKDVELFLDAEAYLNLMSSDKYNPMKIIQNKKILNSLKKDYTNYIFEMLEYLCQLTKHFQEVGFVTKYIKTPITIYPFHKDDE